MTGPEEGRGRVGWKKPHLLLRTKPPSSPGPECQVGRGLDPPFPPFWGSPHPLPPCSLEGATLPLWSPQHALCWDQRRRHCGWAPSHLVPRSPGDALSAAGSAYSLVLPCSAFCALAGLHNLAFRISSKFLAFIINLIHFLSSLESLKCFALKRKG